jgi:hypothetical protein
MFPVTMRTRKGEPEGHDCFQERVAAMQRTELGTQAKYAGRAALKALS